MVTVELTIPEHLDMRVAQMVDDGEFVDREEAIEELMATGIKAYKTRSPDSEIESDTGFDDDMMGHEDEYVF